MFRRSVCLYVWGNNAFSLGAITSLPTSILVVDGIDERKEGRKKRGHNLIYSFSHLLGVDLCSTFFSVSLSLFSLLESSLKKLVSFCLDGWIRFSLFLLFLLFLFP